MTPFPMIEKAVRQLIETYEPAQGKTGGAPRYVRGNGLYVWITLVSGTTDQLEGEWTVDVDVFADDYGTAMNHALALEPVLIGPRKVTELMRLDNVYQNEAPVRRPWDDETMERVGATYVFTARRKG